MKEGGIMPELPEVETVKRVVGPQIKNKKITGIRIVNESVIAYPECDKFMKMVQDSIITGMTRRGKFLGIHLDNGKHIYVHLRMTGCLIVTPKDWPMEKHTHLILELDDGNEIRYVDSRRFGRFWVLGNEEDKVTGMNKLGLEPFDDMLTAEYLQKKLGHRKKAIKECLLDQSIVTGIGNIYGDEILFECGINPQRKACDCTEEQWKELSVKIPEILSFFIEKNAISNEDYLIGKGKDYRNAPYIKIYGHEGMPCPVCGEPMVRVVISGRSSVFCPVCQK